ncbi:hypothetical protein D9619_005213 [Psilocybe cf. subviscida]|uniref:DUF4139 domain-containing protein n=1 Tax=Psilocybe cf. subviscida TaxID=2480587 RepID=A0A8H5BVV3_9AGAR|nr:hypothetical protein D9619_005213 [Psilocybe cf. subviscida]
MITSTAISTAQTIVLVAADDSVIENINLYPGRAELTRIFKVVVHEGENHVDIHGLPVSLVDDSLRIEGHGWATICDVVVSQDDPDRISALSSTTTQIASLKRQRKELFVRVSATQQSRSALGTYLNTIKADNTGLASLSAIFEEQERLAGELDVRILDLEKELSDVDKLIDAERENSQSNNAKQLTRKISITVLAQKAGEVTVDVKYRKYLLVVQGANWKPIYEIQANTQSTEKPLTLLYKALITQSTYEFWKNTTLTLETITPSLSMSPPHITPWHLWVRHRRPSTPLNVYNMPMSQPHMHMAAMQQPTIIINQPPTMFPSSRSRSRSPPPRMQHLQVAATDNGGIMATFRVPGVVNLPSDGQQHNMTIAQLDLQADFIWYTIPSQHARTFIKAKIKNGSDYRFISGKAKTYVDGSFASTGTMPAVSPQDTFDFSLGIDPGIKVTYHPREKKAAQSGIYSKSTNHTFIQRISIHNAKSTPVKNLKVTDRVPISDDQRIEVRLISPALTLPAATSATEKNPSSILKLKSKQSVSDTVKVSSSVTANWNGLGEQDVDQKALGKDGVVCWLVSLAAQGRVTLVLQYEVSHAEGLDINGF